MSITFRDNLGEFSSVVCLKSIITGMEDALGDKATAIALIAAGRARGKQIINDLGLAGQSLSLEEISSKMALVLGSEGTRLLILDKLEQDGDVYRAYTKETICSAGEPEGSQRQCTFTLGAVQGALEVITGKRLRGKHIESVLRGGSHDVFEYTVLD